MVNLIMALALSSIEVKTVDYFDHAVVISQPYSYFSLVGNPPQSRVFYTTQDMSMNVSIFDISGELVQNIDTYSQVPTNSQLYKNVYLVPQNTYFQVFVSGLDYRSYQLEFTPVPEPASVAIFAMAGFMMRKK